MCIRLPCCGRPSTLPSSRAHVAVRRVCRAVCHPRSPLRSPLCPPLTSRPTAGRAAQPKQQGACTSGRGLSSRVGGVCRPVRLLLRGHLFAGGRAGGGGFLPGGGQQGAVSLCDRPAQGAPGHHPRPYDRGQAVECSAGQGAARAIDAGGAGRGIQAVAIWETHAVQAAGSVDDAASRARRYRGANGHRHDQARIPWHGHSRQ
mmetsp:Transcript_3837/g.12145  ORF Transcript_3837/g.12145 Transcript_3837/m.12145 type:complete len:203 (+) Transcript_3837:425-1033(+)